MIKKINTVSVAFGLLVVVATTGVFSCATSGKGKNDTPEYVAEQFLNHLLYGRLQEAKEFATTNTLRMIAIMELVLKTKDTTKIDYTAYAIKDLKCEKTSRKCALCTYVSNGKPDKLELVRENGHWLVEMKKEASPEGSISE